ncbi:MAG: CHRD domain-containing protein [Proteobacteria bacterium]|nr:CHRD domain-containing protein [Pseudomonadota bacterium]
MKQSIVSPGRRGLVPLFAAAAFAVAGLSGIAAAHADPITLTAKLVPVPGAPPTGLGHFVATYDPATLMLHWHLTYAGLSGPVVAAHIHGPATPGMNAPPVIFFQPPLTSPIDGSQKLTLDQVSQLLGGLYYANLHTQAFPNGEIRGQLNVQPTN